jgi:hypothetical protein
MAAEIKFYANIAANDTFSLINHAAGSGLGFYGSEHGTAVPVGDVQRSTYVTNANGSAQGAELRNTAYANDDAPGVGTNESESFVRVDNDVNRQLLKSLPNQKCPLNVRLTTDDGTAVSVRNCKLSIYDRVNINNHASGVTTYVYEARHPLPTDGTQYALAHVSSRTDPSHHTWFEFSQGNPIDMLLTDSPGISGFNTQGGNVSHLAGLSVSQQANFNLGSNHESSRHDWYIAISSSPDSIGSKQDYALYFEAEYL